MTRLKDLGTFGQFARLSDLKASLPHDAQHYCGTSIQAAFDCSLGHTVQFFLGWQVVPVNSPFQRTMGCINAAVPCIVCCLLSLVRILQCCDGAARCLHSAFFGLKPRGGQLGWIGQQVGRAFYLVRLLMGPVHNRQGAVVTNFRAAGKRAVVLPIE